MTTPLVPPERGGIGERLLRSGVQPALRALLARARTALPDAGAGQVMRALDHVQADATRLQVDPTRFAIGGDSAGAQIAAQAGALVTTDGYAGMVGVEPTIARDQLWALVLACGPYDLACSRAAAAAPGGGS